MKTILFFNRAHLPKLYGRISKYLNNVQVIHVAYSKAEADALKAFDVKADFVYLDMFKEIYDSLVLNDELLNKVDYDIIEQSEGRFNLNSAIQSDRGFALLTYEESLRSAVAHYFVWEAIFSKYHVDILEHEPCSLFFNYIAAILCKKQGGHYTYQIAIANDVDAYSYINANDGEYIFYELQANYKKYIENPSLIDVDRCKKYLKVFRDDRGVFMGELLHKKKYSIFRLFFSSQKEKLRRLIAGNKYDRIYSNIEYWSFLNNDTDNQYVNAKEYKIKKIRFEESIPRGEKYYFYPFHLEPEAVVQYLADGIYKNQVKLIENIAASLPPGTYLYVKDHPHKNAYRKADDYERLMKIPNIRLLDSRFSGKEIIQNSIGVITINGSAGYEALLMGKQVYCFGTCMYSFMPRVSYLQNIRDLRNAIYNNLSVRYEDDIPLFAYVMSILTSTHVGYIDGFVGGVQIPNMDIDENCRVIAEGIEIYVNNITQYEESISVSIRQC